MADPFSLVASIVGLIAIGTEVSIKLYEFVDSVRSAPADIRELAQELTDLCSILGQLQTVLTKDNGVRHGGLLADFQHVLDSCMEKLVQLRMLAKAHEIKDGATFWSKKWKAVSWTFQEKEIGVLRTQLGAHKATLKIALLLSTYKETTSIKDSQEKMQESQERIETTMREIKDMLKKGDGDTAAGRRRDNVVLQRYLSSASSRFSPSRLSSTRGSSSQFPSASSRSTSPTLRNSFEGEDDRHPKGLKDSDSWEMAHKEGDCEPALGQKEEEEEVKTEFDGVKEPEKNLNSFTISHSQEPDTTTCSLIVPEAKKTPEPQTNNINELEGYLFSPEPPSLPQLAVLEDARKAIEKASQDMDFIEEITLAYQESEKYRWRKLDDERIGRAEKHEAYVDGLYWDKKITYSDLGVMDLEFKSSEARKKAEEEEDEYRIYCSEVFQQAHDRLYKGIGDLMGMYGNIAKNTPNAPAGRDRWLKAGCEGLVELLEELLELRSHIEKRYEIVLAEILGRDRRLKGMKARLLYADNNFEMVRSIEEGFKENARKVTFQFAQEKLERTRRLMETIEEDITRGLDAELAYLEELAATIDSIPTKLASPFCDLILMKREVAGDYEKLKTTRERAIEFIKIYHHGTLLVNEATNGVAFAEAVLARSGEDILDTIQKEKMDADHEADNDLQNRVDFVEGDFVVIERNIKAALDRLAIVEDTAARFYT